MRMPKNVAKRISKLITKYCDSEDMSDIYYIYYYCGRIIKEKETQADIDEQQGRCQVDKFSRVRASIKDTQRKLIARNSRKTPKELDIHERFEDDARALKEIEYGRVVRKPTTPLSSGSTLGTVEFENKKWS